MSEIGMRARALPSEGGLQTEAPHRHKSGASSSLRQDVLLSSREVGEHVLHPYVYSHYRPMLTGSILAATIRGVLTWHNETANIWTHLFGFGWATSRLMAVQTADAGSPFVRAAVGTFHLSAMTVLMASTAAHLYAPILPAKASQRLWRLDHACIIIAIGGSYVPGLQYGFRCHPLARIIYSAVACAGLVTSFYLTLVPRPAQAGRDWLRIGALCTTVVFGLAPTVHFCLHASADDFDVMIPGLMGMFVAYGIGLAVYVSLVPERLAPGTFACLTSHAIWHVCIVAALASWDHSLDQMLRRDWECLADL
jgi:adiponectin receptor